MGRSRPLPVADKGRRMTERNKENLKGASARFKGDYISFRFRNSGCTDTDYYNDIKQKGILMYILGIESSCDETAASIVKDGREIISNIVYSQVEEHGLYGGVVP